MDGAADEAGPEGPASATTENEGLAPTASSIWLLGLPITPHTTESAIAVVVDAVSRDRRILFATPNLNFLRMAAEDSRFARQIMDCDMNLADGTPLLWLARALGAPLPERVSGSGMFERLVASDLQPPVRAFFFGGEPGVAETARRHLEGRSQGVVGVGAADPGFGSVDDMSSEEMLGAINAAKPDFLVVSLGARNGHEWLERNRARLQVNVASHLGAVVNFIAGTIKRAPATWQGLGLEWLWRTLEEPRLATRYLRDGLFLGRLFLLNVAPLAVTHRLSGASGEALSVERRSADMLILRGQLTGSTRLTLDRWRQGPAAGDPLPERGELDLSDLERVDALGLGALHDFLRTHERWRLVAPGAGLRRQLRLHRALALLEGDDARGQPHEAR